MHPRFTLTLLIVCTGAASVEMYRACALVTLARQMAALTRVRGTGGGHDPG